MFSFSILLQGSVLRYKISCLSFFFTSPNYFSSWLLFSRLLIPIISFLILILLPEGCFQESDKLFLYSTLRPVPTHLINIPCCCPPALSPEKQRKYQGGDSPRKVPSPTKETASDTSSDSEDSAIIDLSNVDPADPFTIQRAESSCEYLFEHKSCTPLFFNNILSWVQSRQSFGLDVSRYSQDSRLVLM